ncbi:MAG: hypothetical protein CXZ00_09500 [Acidobacteria bacterium]|nr:MAG: hypothetical protein CXZ00_09500 [Acidobacteriota bacterium]
MIEGMGWTSPEANELFNFIVRGMAEERRKQRKRICDALKTPPTTEETLAQLCSLSPQDFERVMRAHPAYKTQRNIESIQTMIEVFHRAMSDLKTAVGEFPTLGPPDARGQREALEIAVSVRVNKELLAAVGASQSLVAYSRRVRDQLPSDLFDKERIEVFDENEHALVKDLRNLLAHQLHTAANWQTVYSKGSRSTHFKIETEDLLAEAELSAAAKLHLATLGETVDVSELLSNYAERVDRFYGWLLPELERYLPESVKDFRRCRDTVKHHHGRQSYKLLLGLWIQANADPYAHLSKHLTSEQLATVSNLPHRSATQVDYIISCLDRTGSCNEELRKLVYLLFKVVSPNDAT